MIRTTLAILAAAALCARAYDPIVYPTNAPSGEVIAPFLATNVVSDLLADAISTNAPAGETAALRMVLADVAEQVRAMPGGDDYDEIVDATLALAYSNQITRAEAAALYAPKTNAVTPAALAAALAAISPSSIGAAPEPRSSWTNIVRSANPVVDIAFEPYEWMREYSTTNAAQTLVVDSAYVPPGPPRFVRLSGFAGVAWPSGSRVLGGAPATDASASVWEVGTAFGTFFARRLWDEE